MSREIKFRVWDTVKKCYRDLSENDTYLGEGKIYCESLFLDEQGKLNYGNRLIFQQFTGCVDKNGREVYEGDIIGGLTEMVFLMSGAKTGQKKQVYQKIIWSDKHNGWDCHDLSRKEPSAIGGINIALKFYPVIGNIFENPELLPK